MSDWAHTLEVKWSPLCHSFRPLLPDVRRVDIQLYHIAIGVIEVNGFGHLVIVRVDLEACRFKVQLCLAKFVDVASDLEGDVEEPW